MVCIDPKDSILKYINLFFHFMKEFLLPHPDWNHYIFSLILKLNLFFSPSEIPNDLVISECIHVCYVLFFKYFNYIAI